MARRLSFFILNERRLMMTDRSIEHHMVVLSSVWLALKRIATR
jgi:hypothetical protein